MISKQKALLGFKAIKQDEWLNLSINNKLLTVTPEIWNKSYSLENNTIDYIVCDYYPLQQLPIYDLLSVLNELYRLLKSGGVIRFCLFDLDKAINAYKSSPSDCDYFWSGEWETTSGSFIAHITNYGYLYTPLTYEFSEELLKKTGFQKVFQVISGQTKSYYTDIVELDKHLEQYFFSVEAFKATKLGTQKRILGGKSTQIHCSWVNSPNTSFTVTWHTPSEKNCVVVEYRPLGTTFWNRVQGSTKSSPGEGYLHQATLSGLFPNTEYEYRTSNDQQTKPRMSEIYQTCTAPNADSADFSFVFICDTGLIGRLDDNATGTKQIIEEIINDKPLFILGGGDYAYANGDRRYTNLNEAIDAWFNQMQPIIARFPFMAQYGNHEILLEERFRDWAPRFNHPKGFDGEKNYSFDVGNAHFTALFVPDPSMVNSEQLTWLDADLRKARNRGMNWLIVYQHQPIFGHGHSHPANPQLSQLLSPIFEKYQVDLHLSGHDQNYERTYPLLGLPYNPTPISTSINHYQAGNGVVYAKVSPGGKKSEKKNDFSRFIIKQQSFMAKRDDTAHHYALVKVQAIGKLKINVYSVIGDSTPKQLIDSFELR